MSNPTKVKLIQIYDLEPECPNCTGSNAMLNDRRDPDLLTCRDCKFSVEKNKVEIELITMKEAQSRLKKYGNLLKL